MQDGEQLRLIEPDEKIPQFTMTVQGGMLEALGINMYTTVGKCLVEFVANAYDSNASHATITIPFEQIDDARRKLRESARAAVANGERAKFRVLLDPLDDDIVITIEDDGHGMLPWEVQDKFLPLNRNRREAPDVAAKLYKTEGGLRYAMGRKGLGKMAGFGAAELVTIWTKRKGKDYATKFTLSHEVLAKTKDLNAQPITPEYLPADPDVSGTKVTLSRLRCDALSSKAAAIKDTIVENFFGIDSGDFSISLNRELLEGLPVFYEFQYPAQRDPDGYASDVVVLDDGETIPFRYVVKFRGRKDDEFVEDGLIRGSLPAKKRGARVYCNKRLAAGPSLFDLETGMHNFHSQSYLECIVEADDLDRHDVDLVNTNRSDLRRDNEIVDTFITTLTDIMRRSLAAHARFREGAVENQIRKNQAAAQIYKIIEHLPKRQQAPSKAILQTLAVDFGVNSTQFEKTAPLVVQSLSAGEVLVTLGKLTDDPQSYTVLAEQLAELGRIEKSDALKLYRARKDGIMALQKLVERGDEQWKKGPRFEDELHSLLKAYPWLIRPEYSRFLTSNQSMANVARALSATLKIDDHAALVGKKDLRPDLVFLLQDSQDVRQIVIVEIKSPNLPLNQDHTGQLRGYMEQARVLIRKYTDNDVYVRGYLIGALPNASTQNASELVVLNEYQSKSTVSYEILTVHDMLRLAVRTHLEAIEVLESEGADEKSEDATESQDDRAINA